MGRHKGNSGILSNSYIYVRWFVGVSIFYQNTYEKTRFDAGHWNSGHGLDIITQRKRNGLKCRNTHNRHH